MNNKIIYYFIPIILIIIELIKYNPVGLNNDINYFIVIYTLLILFKPIFSLKKIILSFLLANILASIDLVDIIYNNITTLFLLKKTFSGITFFYIDIFLILIYMIYIIVYKYQKIKINNNIFFTFLFLFITTFITTLFHYYFVQTFKYDFLNEEKNYEKILNYNDIKIKEISNNTNIKYYTEKNINNLIFKNELFLKDSTLESIKSVLKENGDFKYTWHVIDFQEEKINNSYVFGINKQKNKYILIAGYNKNFGINVYFYFLIIHTLIILWFFIYLFLIYKHKLWKL